MKSSISCVRLTTRTFITVSIKAERGLQNTKCDYLFVGKQGLVTFISRTCNRSSDINNNMIHSSVPNRFFRSSSIQKDKKKGHMK